MVDHFRNSLRNSRGVRTMKRGFNLPSGRPCLEHLVHGSLGKRQMRYLQASIEGPKKTCLNRESTGMKNSIRSNFDMLHPYEVQLWRLGALAERYFAEDPTPPVDESTELHTELAQLR